MIGCRNNHECFVVAGELLESVFAEIQRVGFSPWIISTGLLISSAKVSSGVLMKESAEVLFQCPLELMDLGWKPLGVL